LVNPGHGKSVKRRAEFKLRAKGSAKVRTLAP
jgi:hypothetical protein